MVIAIFFLFGLANGDQEESYPAHDIEQKNSENWGVPNPQPHTHSHEQRHGGSETHPLAGDNKRLQNCLQWEQGG